MKTLIAALLMTLLLVATVSHAKSETSAKSKIVTDMDTVLLNQGSEVSYFTWRGR